MVDLVVIVIYKGTILFYNHLLPSPLQLTDFKTTYPHAYHYVPYLCYKFMSLNSCSSYPFRILFDCAWYLERKSVLNWIAKCTGGAFISILTMLVSFKLQAARCGSGEALVVGRALFEFRLCSSFFLVHSGGLVSENQFKCSLILSFWILGKVAIYIVYTESLASFSNLTFLSY